MITGYTVGHVCQPSPTGDGCLCRLPPIVIDIGTNEIGGQSDSLVLRPKGDRRETVPEKALSLSMKLETVRKIAPTKLVSVSFFLYVHPIELQM